MVARGPRHREDLKLQRLAEGQFVAKDQQTGAYFRLGEEELFLFYALDGKRKRAFIERAYKSKFGEELTHDDLDTFIRLATEKGLLETPAVRPDDTLQHGPGGENETTANGPTPGVAAQPAGGSSQSLLYWRHRIFDPDRLLSWMAPKLGLFWTKSFFFVSAAFIAAAVVTAWSNAYELAHHVARSTSWSAALGVWVILLGITTVHEFGHGLTCKRHGGEVREMGFLLMYLMPCLYCNVSDTWLIADKRKRLWVTAAGGYVELCLWATAVFVWRLTVPDVFINYVALTVIVVSGFRILFNFNPFLKLDGYYLLSDCLEMPNLRQRAWDYVAGHIRWILWGAGRPEKLPRGTLLFCYGIACWCFSAFATVTMLHLLGKSIYSHVGMLGMGVVVILALFAIRGLFRGVFNGEARQMFLTRHVRLFGSLAAIAALVAALCIIEMPKRATGTFAVCPLARREVRTPIAGFLREVKVDEGQRVSATEIAAVLEVPDLDSRIAQKQAQRNECDANLRLLRQGTRLEEIAEQRQKVTRQTQLRDLAKKDVVSAAATMQAELKQLNEKVNETRLVAQQAYISAGRTADLYQKRVVTAETNEIDQTAYRIAAASFQAAKSAWTARQAAGIAVPQQELAMREKELADQNGALDLLLAGTRKEKIDAELAEHARLEEELKYLQSIKSQLPVPCGSGGIVVTPRVKEKVSQYLKEGDLICIVEEMAGLEIEIELPEQELRDVKIGQPLELKARSLPFETFEATVERIAPSAKDGEVQSSVVVYTHLKNPPPMLRPGMTGYARIECDSQPIAKIAANKVLRYVRTEFWW